MPYFFSCAGFFGRKWGASSFLLQCRSSRTASPVWAGTSTPSACLQSIIGSEIVWNISLKHTYKYLKNLVNYVNKLSSRVPLQIFWVDVCAGANTFFDSVLLRFAENPHGMGKCLRNLFMRSGVIPCMRNQDWRFLRASAREPATNVELGEMSYV